MTRRNEEEERTFVAESPHVLRFWHDVIYMNLTKRAPREQVYVEGVFGYHNWKRYGFRNLRPVHLQESSVSQVVKIEAIVQV